MLNLKLTTEQAEILRLYLLGTACDAYSIGCQHEGEQIDAIQAEVSKLLNKNVDMPEVRLADIPW